MLSTFGKFCGVLVAVAMAVVCADPAFAQDTAQAAASAAPSFLSKEAMALFAAAFAIGIGTIAPALGQGNAIAKAMEAIGRNPEAGGQIRTLLLIGLAFVESLCIYALVIAFIAIGKA